MSQTIGVSNVLSSKIVKIDKNDKQKVKPCHRYTSSMNTANCSPQHSISSHNIYSKYYPFIQYIKQIEESKPKPKGNHNLSFLKKTDFSVTNL